MSIWPHSYAVAQNVLEKLVMPGPLAKAHEKLEKDCNNCHVPFERKAQQQRCLDCHKDIASDIRTKRGMHGKQPQTANVPCRHCHTDHQGRDADIVQFDRETFNHAVTNFPLAGAHRFAGCDACHVSGKKFRETPGTCSQCHAKVEPHAGQLGKQCDTCHDQNDWLATKPFDHNKTKFVLEAKHREVACLSCHWGEQYKNIGTACASCHAIQDVHEGRYGRDCHSCHTAKGWKTVTFDHGRHTKFPLRGKHAAVKCEGCHKGNLLRDKLSTDCVSCHKSEDPHRGQLGNKCERCHDEAGWKKNVRFDHDVTRFPLVGRHQRVACASCHRTKAYREAPTECSACHKDTFHDGRLGKDCAACHTAKGWPLWRFNHDRQTKYPLTGAHRGLQCHACHRQKQVQRVTAPTLCIECHAPDDVHGGRFGRNCEQCHTTASFKRGVLRK